MCDTCTHVHTWLCDMLTLLLRLNCTHYCYYFIIIISIIVIVIIIIIIIIIIVIISIIIIRQTITRRETQRCR